MPNNVETTLLTVTSQVSNVTTFLDMAEDDDDAPMPVSKLESVEALITSAKRFRSFTSLLYLNAVKEFIKLWDKYKKNPRIKAPMIKASHAISGAIGKGPYMARKIRELYRYIARFQALPPVSRGKHYAHPSLLNDERIMRAVCRYLTILANGQVRCLNNMVVYLTYLNHQITPLLLMKQVNDTIILLLGFDTDGHKISEATARRWLAKLGYELKEARKGVYIDGHERDDVKAYHQEFLKHFLSNER
jgi:hypothetical protein